jgi:hypothetical protein
MPQSPYPRRQKIVRIPPKGQARQVGGRFGSTPITDVPICGVAPDHLSDFEVEQMGRVEGLARGEQFIFDRLCCARLEQHFNHS